jgi:flagellar biosynthesis protein FlhG
MNRPSSPRDSQALRLSVIPGRGQAPASISPRTDDEPISISVVSGKGGVGKSSLIANLAILLARKGLKVIVLDGDLSLANVDLLMGMVPRHNLWDVVAGRRTVAEVLLEGPHGIRLLPASSGVEEMANLDDYRREVLIRSLDDAKRLCDVFLVDTGSGIARQNLRLAQAARHTLILTTPEPTAFSDAYATLKVLLARPMWTPPKLVLNRVRSDAEAMKVKKRLQRVSRHFLHVEPEVWGVIPEDDLVLRSVHAQQPVTDLFPRARASEAFMELADRILKECAGPTGGGRSTVDRFAGAA